MTRASNLVWNWLSDLSTPGAQGPTNHIRRTAWQALTGEGKLLAACCEAAGGEQGESLDRVWEVVLNPHVLGYLDYYYRDSGGSGRAAVDSKRVYRALLGTLAAAQAVQAARQLNPAALLRWVHETAAAWGGTRAAKGLAHPLPWANGLEPETVLDEHLKALRLLAPEHWQVAAARDCVRALLDRSRRVLRGRKVPLLGCKAKQGFLAWLYVEVLEDGTGEFYADPVRMGLVPMTTDFLGAVAEAWSAAERAAQRLRASDFPTNSDVRWRLEGGNLEVLDGGSLGLALTVALVQLRCNAPLDPTCAITGAVHGETVVEVLHVKEKVAAAREVRPGITCVIVPKDNVTEARNGWPGAEHIYGVRTVTEALPIAGGLLEDVCQLLRRQILEIDDACKQRTGRLLPEQFVPVRVARGLRPHLKPEDYEDLERRHAHGKPDSGIEKVSSGRDGLLRDPAAQETIQRKVVPWEDVRDHVRRGVLLGDPGFGKTMLLWHEVRQRCQEQLDSALEQKCGVDDVVPAVFFRADMLAQEMERRRESLGAILIARLAAQTERPEATRDWLQRRLQAGAFFLAVDALEEVRKEVRPALMDGLANFVRDYPQAHVLVGSRLVNYTGAPLRPAEELELMAFDDRQIELAVLNWFGVDEQGRELLAHLRTQPVLRQTLTSPLLLRLACQVAKQARHLGEPLPRWQRRTELYEEFINFAAARWMERTPQEPEPEHEDDFVRSASALAWRLWEMAAGQTLFKQGQLTKAVRFVQERDKAFAGRKSPIKDLCDAGLLTRAGGLGTPHLFTHRTFHEYLVARALAERNDWLQVALDHVYDPQWHEVLQMLAGVLDGSHAVEYVKALLRKNREDLLGRPFRMAVLAAANARDDHLEDGLTEALLQVVLNLHFCPGSLLAQDEGQAILVAWGNRSYPGLVDRFIQAECRDTCQATAEVLGQLGARAREALLECLDSDDHDYRLRNAAARALGLIRDPKALEYLIARLRNDPKWWVRQAAAEALGRLGDPKALEALLACFREDPAREVCQAAAEALGRLGDPKALEPLATCLLNHWNAYLRWAAAAALGCLGDPGAVEPLRFSVRNDPDEEVRWVAVQALGRLGDLGLLEPLLAFVRDDQDWWVRQAAAWALGQLGDPQALEPLRACLRDDLYENVRWAAAGALGQLGDPGALDPLCACLRDDHHEDVRRAAAWGLGRLGDPRALEPLCACFREDPASEVCQAAAEALGRLGDPRALEPLCACLRGDHRDNIRWAAAGALGHLDDPGAIEPLIECLLHEREWGYVRRAIAEALQKIAWKLPECVPPSGVIPQVRKWHDQFNRSLAKLLGKRR